MGKALQVEGLSRVFDASGQRVQALRDVDLCVDARETVGVLGLNGAGKTTLIKIVATLLLPTAGTVRVDGADVVADVETARRSLAVVFGGDRGLYNRLSALDNARFFATMSGLPRRGLDDRVRDALGAVGLGEAADRKVETYSKGMRQRLHLAIGLIATPSLLLLDEPTVGLDPVEAQRLRGVIAGLRERGVTIILTSHYLRDIEQLASRVVVLQGGAVTHDLPLAAFLRQTNLVATVRIAGTGRPPPAPPSGELSTTEGAWTLTVGVEEWTPASLRDLASAWPIADGRRQVLDVTVEPVNLERVFADLARAAEGPR